MVKQQEFSTAKSHGCKGILKPSARASKINASTAYDTCREQLSPFGGLLALIKFLDLIKFKQLVDDHYRPPRRRPILGDWGMLAGVLMLLFIGFNRLWHFTYVRLDSLLCGYFHLTRLPAASTYWRYVDSLGINQANSLVNLMSGLRQRIWKLCELHFHRLHINLDTTVETLYGNQQGARKGHNPSHRGKKGYRPVLAFIEQTRECLLGRLRKGETLSGAEAAAFIHKLKRQLPEGTHRVLLRGDAEFLSWDSVAAASDEGFQFIFGNKVCQPVFDHHRWYRARQRAAAEYNSCLYQPMGWSQPCRFVAMRIPKEHAAKNAQQPLFDEDRFTHRVFCTNLKTSAHKAIAIYDRRADVENLIGEVKREGLDAIPSAKFNTNAAFFQLVLLAYNIWRYFKLIAQQSLEAEEKPGIPLAGSSPLRRLQTHTNRIGRLRLLLIAAKVVFSSNRNKLRYSTHDARTPTMIGFLRFLDRLRSRPWPWCVHKTTGDQPMLA
jgi:Transposase DDE domain group 1